MGKKIVITGLTKGLGRALLEVFAKKGWTVAGFGRSREAVEELKNTYGDQHLFSILDIGDVQAVEAWKEDVLAFMGPPDILINNAFVINSPCKSWMVDLEELRLSIQINILGTYAIIKSFMPVLLKQEKPIVATISSAWGREADAFVAPYCMAKFALEGLSQSLSKETKGQAIVVTVDPGTMQTAMLKEVAPRAVYEGANDPKISAQKIYDKLIHLDFSDTGQQL